MDYDYNYYDYDNWPYRRSGRTKSIPRAEEEIEYANKKHILQTRIRNNDSNSI